MVKAPWTADQVASLNAYQKSGVFHEFTHGNGEVLVATKDGWVLPNDQVEVIQDWAHDWMADWSWKATSKSIADAASFDSTSKVKTTPVRFLGLGNGFEDVVLDVMYVAQYARGPSGLCAFCHGDPCAESSDKESNIARFFAKNAHQATCPVCEGRAS